MAITRRNSSTPKQIAYARQLWGGGNRTRTQIALDVGYAPSVAATVGQHVEKSRGFQNAVGNLAAESNALALTIMAEFKTRGVENFSNKDLISSLNAIGGAWGKFNLALSKERDMTGPNTKLGMNKLRTVILNQIENQTIMPEGVILHDGTPNEELLDF